MAVSRVGISPAILLFAACSFWGIATVLNKALLASVAPTLLLFIQLLASVAVLWPVCLFLRKALPKGRAFWMVIALGILNPGISYTFGLLGLKSVSASIASLLWATEPFLILMLAWAFLNEAITARVLGVIVFGFAGVVLVSGSFAGPGDGSNDIAGVAFMFVAVLLCAIYTIESRRIRTEVDALALVTVQQTAGLGWAAVLAVLFTDGPIIEAVAKMPHGEIWGAVFSGLLYYAAAYWLYLSALGRVSATLAGGSFNIIPIVTIAVAFVFLGERLTWTQALGAALIILSALALFRLTRQPQDASQISG